MCLLLQPQNKKINVQENPCERAPPLRSVPLAFIIKLFNWFCFLKNPLTNQADYDIIIVVKFNSYRFGHDCYASIIGRISIVLGQKNYIYL